MLYPGQNRYFLIWLSRFLLFFFISIFKICIWKLKIEVSRSDSASFFLLNRNKSQYSFQYFVLKKSLLRKIRERMISFLFFSITLPWRIGIFFSHWRTTFHILHFFFVSSEISLHYMRILEDENLQKAFVSIIYARKTMKTKSVRRKLTCMYISGSSIWRPISLPTSVDAKPI